MAAIHQGYVIGDNGYVYLQIPDDTRWGFSLHDDDQSWAGGFGSGCSTWEPVDADDPRVTDADRERLQWVLDEINA